MGHRECPLDDFLVFNVAFGKTVPDISYSAIATLGYADVRFMARVYAGDTLTCESSVLGLKENSSGRSGVVYVRSRAFNQEGVEVLSWARWVMVARRKPAEGGHQHAPEVPALPKEVEAARLAVPAFLKPAALEPRYTGSALLWEDFTAGDIIDRPAGLTLDGCS